MYDAEALSGKSLAELREIGKKLGIKAQMRKQALIDKILEQSERPESGESPLQETSPAETPQSDHPVPQKRERRKKINAVKVTGVGSDTKPETELPIPSEPFFAENAAEKRKNRKTRHAPKRQTRSCGGRNGTIPEREKNGPSRRPPRKPESAELHGQSGKKQNGTRPEKKPDRLYETGNADGGSERRCKTTRP